MMRVNPPFILLLIMLLISPVHAGDTAAAFDAGASYSGAVDPAAAIKGGGNFTLGDQTYGIDNINAINQAQGGEDLSNPPEAALWGSETLDATEAYANSSEGQWVTGSAATRPMFTINPATDPLLQTGKAIKDDPTSIIGTLGETYSDCTTLTVTGSAAYEEKVCQETRDATEVSCAKILTVACDPPADGCEEAGIVPQTVLVTNGSYTFTFDAGAFTLINSITATNSRTTADFNMEIEGVDRVSEFAITGIHSDNWVGLRVNGTYIGTHSRHLGGFNTSSDRLEAFVDRQCIDGFCFNINKVQYSETGSYYTDTGHNFYSNVSFDLRPYLTEGGNTITMYVINGGGPGYGRVYIRARQRCPRNCVDTWDDQCAAYEARTQ
jgi:hypothetical protein